MEDLLLQEARLSRSLIKTYNKIKESSKGKKDEKYYAMCILATLKYEGRQITDELKKKMALKSGLTRVKLEKEFEKFENQLPKSDKQIATDVGIRLKASFSIESKFVAFKSKYLNTLSAIQKESTSAEPLAIVTLYMEASKHSKLSKAKYVKDFKKGSKLFDELCNTYDLLMNEQQKPVVTSKTKHMPIIPKRSRMRHTNKQNDGMHNKSKKLKLAEYFDPLFSRCIPLEQSPVFIKIWKML